MNSASFIRLVLSVESEDINKTDFLSISVVNAIFLSSGEKTKL